MKTGYPAPEVFFKEQVENYSRQLAAVKKKIKHTATWRIISFMATIVGIYLTAGHSLTAVLIIAVGGFSLFGFFVFRHVRLFRLKTRTEKLLQINENEMRLLHLDTSQQPEGWQFLDFAHPFAADLDIFGKKSLFQLLDRCTTRVGREQLAFTLLYPPKQKEKIVKRQQAVAELTEKVRWRQQFQMRGKISETETGSISALLQWAKETVPVFDKPVYHFLLIIIPLLGLGDVVLISLGLLPMISFLVFLLLPFAVLSPRSGKIDEIFNVLGKQTAALEKYAVLFEELQQEKFRSEIMQEVVRTLIQEETSAHTAIKKLSAITRAFDFRLNMVVAFFLNTFFLWDILQVVRLERWKKRYGNKLSLWFDNLALTEELCSLAGFAFQHPDAVYPEIRMGGFYLQGRNLKHPFLPSDKCVGNPVEMEGRGRFHVITGANMAGKSTYLRTVGVNLLLAMTGAPVLADELVFTPVQLFTGIKTSDSLQEGESYFFAELKRLREIVRRLEKGEKLFVILDEILRGTNSKDKQNGSKALLRRFVGLGASGLIATHDLTLGELAGDFPENVVNKRFEVEIKDNRLHFDYLLKEGVSQNLNATFLMKKMGIIE